MTQHPDFLLCVYHSLISTAWLPLPVASYSFLTEPPTKLFEDTSLPPLYDTMCPSCDPPPHIPSCLRTLQISAAMLPTVLRLPAVFVCRTLPTSFPPLPALIPPRASPIPCLSTIAPASLWYDKWKPCVTPPPSAPLPLKGPKSQNQRVVTLVSPPCRKGFIPWGTLFPVLAASQTSPRLTLRTWCFAKPTANHFPFGLGVDPDTWSLPLHPPDRPLLPHIDWTTYLHTSRPSTHPSVWVESPFLCCTYTSAYAWTDYPLACASCIGNNSAVDLVPPEKLPPLPSSGNTWSASKASRVFFLSVFYQSKKRDSK